MTEVEFLLTLAITGFNKQYGRNFNINDFCLFSITPSTGFDLGYEIQSITELDNLRLRIYLTIGAKDDLSNYRLEVNYPSYSETLGDEVYVALGEIDNFYINNGMYSFREINTCHVFLNAIATEDGDIITTENGEYILLE